MIKAFRKIRSNISQINGMPVEQISMQDSLIKTLKMDSIELIELLIRLEEHGIHLHEDQVNAELTVGDLVTLYCKPS